MPLSTIFQFYWWRRHKYRGFGCATYL